MSTPGAPRAQLVPVAVGGALGATLRWGLLELIGTGATLPVAVMTINVGACLILGVLASQRESLLTMPLWSLAAIGFCGGLSTFSTLALDVAQLLDDRMAVAAIATLALSVLTGLAAVVAGRQLGRTLGRAA